jgi:hypothetical protein
MPLMMNSPLNVPLKHSSFRLVHHPPRLASAPPTRSPPSILSRSRAGSAKESPLRASASLSPRHSAFVPCAQCISRRLRTVPMFPRPRSVYRTTTTKAKAKTKTTRASFRPLLNARFSHATVAGVSFDGTRDYQFVGNPIHSHFFRSFIPFSRKRNEVSPDPPRSRPIDRSIDRSQPRGEITFRFDETTDD